MDTIAVILAGGDGTRFWPLSRQSKPKQFLNISGNDIMVNETISRYEMVISPKNTIIVTNRSQADVLRRYLSGNVPGNNILTEPVGRNTAACILYAALKIRKTYDEAVMAVFPSDHYFTDIKGFGYILGKACDAAASTVKLVSIGIKPSFPATGYGYIKYNKKVNAELPKNTFEADEFVEKPSFEQAMKYVKSGEYLWNSGIFAWRVSVILECFERYLPRLYSRMMRIYEHIGTCLEEEYIDRIYPDLQSISIDYGILERSDNILVVPGDFDWSDIGSWDAIGVIFPPDKNGNIVKSKHVGIDTRNTIIYGNGRLIATLGIDGLIIAETEDAVLVCPKDRAQDIKYIVDYLNENGMNEFV